MRTTTVFFTWVAKKNKVAKLLRLMQNPINVRYKTENQNKDSHKSVLTVISQQDILNDEALKSQAQSIYLEFVTELSHLIRFSIRFLEGCWDG